jgi:hypothetical protein
MIIKTEKVFAKVIISAKLGGLGDRPVGLIEVETAL